MASSVCSLSCKPQLPGSGIDVIVVQLSMWDADRDTAEQQAALDELHALAVANDALLVLVSSPPTRTSSPTKG